MDNPGTASAQTVEVADHTISASEAKPSPLSWTPLSRLAFRIAFIYFFCFLFLYGNGSIFEIIPVVGGWINNLLTWPMNHVAVWTGHHVFHLTGVAATWHPTGSGDTTLNWILNGLFVFFALVGGLLWTAIATLRGSCRTEYQTLHAWLRFLLRLTVGLFMVGYGLSKVFPMQMAPISIAILNEPVGQTSPMTLLWSLIALNPIYESICGVAEVIGGTLILFRRTALMGALFSAFVMSNVVLFNFFFDVPVKLFALNLLLAELFIVLPDIKPLFNFFWRHQPAALVGVWIPLATRRGFRIATRTVEIIFVALLLVVFPVLTGIGWNRQRIDSKTQSPLVGAWHLDSIHPATGSFITSAGLPATDFYVDTVHRAFTRSTDGALWRTYLQIKPADHTLTVHPNPMGRAVTYTWRMPDPDHLILTSLPPKKPKSNPKAKADGKSAPAFTPDVLTLTRTPIPSHYPLLDRGFHFVNQWGLER